MGFLQQFNIKGLIRQYRSEGLSMRRRLAFYLISTLVMFMSLILLLLNFFGIMNPANHQLMDALEGQEDGRIRLEVRESLKAFTFTLSNNGAPIAPELRETIFEPGVSTKGEGRGMGLSIVRKTLAEFGGRIELGEGDETSFVVSIPRENRISAQEE